MGELASPEFTLGTVDTEMSASRPELVADRTPSRNCLSCPSMSRVASPTSVSPVGVAGEG